MYDLEYLKNFSAKEIANKTHLDENTIDAIINRDFEKLKNTNVLMNIKILEREYGVNFSEWLQDFNEYKKNNFIDSKESLKIKPKIISYNSSINLSKGYLNYMVIFIIILAIIGGIYYYFTYYKVENNTVVSEKSVVITNSNSINDIDKKEEVQSTKELNTTTQENTLEKNNIEENLDKKVEEKEQNTLPLKTSEVEDDVKNKVDTQINNDTKDIEIQATSETQENLATKHQLVLNPKQKIWMSAKDLSTKETKNYVLNHSIIFDNDTLIFVGNTHYDLSLDNESVEIPNNFNARYILFKDGKVNFLSKTEYTKLDRKNK